MFDNVLVIVIATIILFCMFRYFATFIFVVISKFIKLDKKRYYLHESILLILLYLMIYMYTLDSSDIKEKLSDQEWYAFYVLIGTAAILWCYLKWRITSFKELPGWEDDDRSISIKKIIIFSLVFIFSVNMGYEQLLSSLSNYKIQSIYIVGNTAIVSCMIAFDRVLNQLYQLHKSKKLK